MLVAVLIGSILVRSVGAQERMEHDCGSDRWAVKILRDADAKLVGAKIDSTTISGLAQIAIPEVAYPFNHRIAPHELTVYRITGVVRQIISEGDKDWHIVVSDPMNALVTMIVEIPDPSCTNNETLKVAWASSRAVMRQVPREGTIEVVGVGFFDFIHKQRGAAWNGFELHPVLSVRIKQSQ